MVNKMAKATHSGNCQVCMNNQKLPNGELSKHGYTTKWGFFAGTCDGSHNLPYEKSCELVKRSIVTMHKKIVELQDDIAQINALPDNIGYIYQYVKATTDQWKNRVPAHYRWNIGKFHKHEKYDFSIQFTANDGTLENNDAGNGTILEVKLYHTNRYIRGIENKIAQMNEYIQMQQKRVDDWVEKELTPV